MRGAGQPPQACAQSSAEKSPSKAASISARADAIKQLASGKPVREHYGDLWRVFFGTKNYDQWSGQRCDCEYGCGPRHGSICFRIGLTDAARKRRQADLSADEVEAAIYYLVNLERVQEAERVAVGGAYSFRLCHRYLSR